MDTSARMSSVAGGGSRGRTRRPSVTELDIHTFEAHNAVTQGAAQSTSSVEEIETNERVAKAAELYMAFVNEQKLSVSRAGWWPTGESRAANIYLVSSGEGFSEAAKLVRVVSSSVIFVASLMSCLASIDCGHSKCEELPAWVQAEMLCLGFFTVEYFTRLLTAHARPPHDQTVTISEEQTDEKANASSCRSTCSWVCQAMNIVDLVSILPFYIEALVSAVTATDEKQPGPYQVVRILRILRVLRVLKLAEVSDSMTLFGRGIKRSRDYIITLTLTLVIITILFASFIFHAESGTPPAAVDHGESAESSRQKPPPSTEVGSIAQAVAEEDEEYFLNVPDVFWFCVSEITTVGNASKSPATVVGQALAIVLACFGVFYLSFAQAVIVNSFQEVRPLTPRQRSEPIAALRDSCPVLVTYGVSGQRKPIAIPDPTCVWIGAGAARARSHGQWC
eukprot:COSAG02_NODE_9034_length_2354_cov_1.513525_2_plen_450_part_00